MAGSGLALDLVAPSSRVLAIPATAIALSDTTTAVANKREVSQLVNDKPVKLATAGADVTALAYSPDGRVLAVGLSTGAIEIYAGADLVTTLRGHSSAIQILDWSAPQLVSGALDQTLVWSFTP